MSFALRFKFIRSTVRLTPIKRLSRLGVLLLFTFPACSGSSPTGADSVIPSQVIVSPPIVEAEPGQIVRFSTKILGKKGEPVIGSVTWQAAGGTIDENGFYVAGEIPGDYSVRAITTARASGQARVTITKLATKVEIDPMSVTLNAGETQRFRAKVFDQDGKPIQTTVHWEALGGVITDNGVYTAGDTPGSYNVTAKSEELSATASVTIAATEDETSVSEVEPEEEPVATAIVVSPSNADVETGENFQFAAQVRDQNGDLMDANVTWAANGGSVTSTGLYTAGDAAGSYTVTAESEGLSATASVTVAAAEEESVPTSIAVSPSSADVEAGASFQFAAKVRDQNGDLMDAIVTWTATGGSITTTGLYSAGNTPGTYSVTAESGDLATTASVTVLSAAALPSQGSIITKATFDRGDFSEWGGPSGDPDYCGKLDRGHVGGDAGVRSEHARSGKYAWKAENDPNLPVGCNPKGSAKILHWAGKTPDDFFISAWYYFPSTYPLELTHGSFMQIKEAHPDSDPIWLPVHGVKNGRHHFWLFAWGGFNPGITQVWGPPVPLDRWFNITMYVKKGYSNGIIRVWIDGTLTWEYKNVNTLGDPAKNTKNDVQWGVQNYTPQFKSLHSWLYIDDVVLYDAQ